VPAVAAAARLAAIIAVSVLALASVACGGGGSDRPTVFAASSLTEVFPRIEPEARYSFGGSNQLAAQIEEGAPADVFASASSDLAQDLHRKGLIEEPVPLASNRLVVVVPASNPAGIASVRDLDRDGVRVVMGAAGVPAGDYARTALAALGLSRVVARAVSQEPDVKGVIGKVATGEADAGLAYATDARAAAGRVRAITIPAAAAPDVRYEIAVVTGSPHAAAARELVARATGPDGRRELATAGFIPPPS
jgi:molybdate transport system substrate-binding protein